jgi:hypothetical protein
MAVEPEEEGKQALGRIQPASQCAPRRQGCPAKAALVVAKQLYFLLKKKRKEKKRKSKP